MYPKACCRLQCVEWWLACNSSWPLNSTSVSPLADQPPIADGVRLPTNCAEGTAYLARDDMDE